MTDHWEQFVCNTIYWAVLADGEGCPSLVSIFETEAQARAWMTWQWSLDEESPLRRLVGTGPDDGGDMYDVLPVVGVGDCKFWNSYDQLPSEFLP